MKVTQRKLDDGKLRLECVATPVEVNEVLQNAYIQFAQQMGLRPEKDKTVAQVAEEQMGIKNLDSIVQEQAIEGLVPYAIDKKNLTPAYPPRPSMIAPSLATASSRSPSWCSRSPTTSSLPMSRFPSRCSLSR